MAHAAETIHTTVGWETNAQESRKTPWSTGLQSCLFANVKASLEGVTWHSGSMDEGQASLGLAT